MGRKYRLELFFKAFAEEMQIPVYKAKEAILSETVRIWEQMPKAEQEQFMKNGRAPSNEEFLVMIINEISRKTAEGRQYEKQLKLTLFH